jgi:hypothetical protein
MVMISWIQPFSSKRGRRGGVSNICKQKGINMKKTIFISMVLAAELFAPLFSQAQGTLYVSNLGQTPTGNNAIGSNAWVAAEFITGTNASGYFLNSVQLLMAAASGTPSGFSVSIYTGPRGPGSSLETLNGSLDPVAAGVYTYSAVTSITLSPRSSYLVVVTGGTDIATGAYEWSQCAASFNSTDGWVVLNGSWFSGNGVGWNTGSGSVDSQFAIYAIAVPEPSTLSLAGLGLAALVFWRRKR